MIFETHPMQSSTFIDTPWDGFTFEATLREGLTFETTTPRTIPLGV